MSEPLAPRPGLFRAVSARALWLSACLVAVAVALELMSAGLADLSPDEMLVVTAAAAALGVLLGALVGVPAAILLAVGRRFYLPSWIGPLLALAGGTALAWWLTDPLGRRLSDLYLLLCAVTGVACGLAAWLAGRRGGLPEIVAAFIIAATGLAGLIAIPHGTYEELQDLGFLVAVAGALAASASLVPALERVPAALVLAAGLAAALAAARHAGSMPSQSRWLVTHDSRGSGRLARAVRAIVDLDRDGHSPVLGGADCDDLDAAIHPLAIDRPGGTDENCNGVDAPAALAAPERGLEVASGQPALDAGAVDRVLLVTIDCWRADALDPDMMPKLSTFAAGGLVFQRLYAGASNTTRSLPLVVGAGPHGPWIADLVRARGISVDAVIAGSVPATLWGFRDPVKPRHAEEVTDAALRLIAPAGRRLLWVHYFDLHAFHESVGDRAVPARPEHLPARYRAAASTIDVAIGRLLAELEQKGLLARTLVLVTGDHGEGLGAHGVAAHSQSGFEEVLRVPGVLRGPGIPAAAIPQLVSHRDIPATLLGAFGLADEAASAERFGLSWLRLRDQTDRPLHRFVIARSARWVSGRETYSALGILVDVRHKLVAGLEDDLVELYDLSADPGEQRDLATSDPDTVRRLQRQLAVAWDLDYQQRGDD